MSEHDLKTWPGQFAAIQDGSKRADVRVDDRGFAVGDVLVLREWVPIGLGQPRGYTGRCMRVGVTHIERGWGLPSNVVVMSIKWLDP